MVQAPPFRPFCSFVYISIVLAQSSSSFGHPTGGRNSHDNPFPHNSVLHCCSQFPESRAMVSGKVSFASGHFQLDAIGEEMRWSRFRRGNSGQQPGDVFVLIWAISGSSLHIWFLVWHEISSWYFGFFWADLCRLHPAAFQGEQAGSKIPTHTRVLGRLGFEKFGS